MKQLRGHNAKIRFEDGNAIYSLHNTDIVTVDGSKIILNTGGWMTSTTKQHMNDALKEFGINAYVYQKDFTWYFSRNGIDTPFVGNKLVLEKYI